MQRIKRVIKITVIVYLFMIPLMEILYSWLWRRPYDIDNVITSLIWMLGTSTVIYFNIKNEFQQ